MLKVQAPQHPCGCRSAGECWHDFGPTRREERAALHKLVRVFAVKMERALCDQLDEGNGGWDSEEWTVEDIVTKLRDHIDKGDPADVANLAAFWWNRLGDKEKTS